MAEIPAFSDSSRIPAESPIYFPLAEYAKQKGNQSLDVFVKSPQYKPDGGRELGYLDVSSSYDATGRQVFLNVLNRSEKNDISANVESISGAPATLDVWELNHPNLKATHTFGADKVVRPAMKSVNVKNERNGFAYLFPKHSLTILKMKTR